MNRLSVVFTCDTFTYVDTINDGYGGSGSDGINNATMASPE